MKILIGNNKRGRDICIGSENLVQAKAIKINSAHILWILKRNWLKMLRTCLLTNFMNQWLFHYIISNLIKQPYIKCNCLPLHQWHKKSQNAKSKRSGPLLSSRQTILANHTWACNLLDSELKIWELFLLLHLIPIAHIAHFWLYKHLIHVKAFQALFPHGC